MNVRFDWDDNKAKSNKQKHGISFEFATRVFNDPLHITIQDRIVRGEHRWQAYGKIYDQIIFVAYTIRINYSDSSKEIRIISARLASRKERKIYDQQNR